MFDQSAGGTEQTAVTADHNRQIDHSANMIAGFHFSFFKMRERGQSILDGDLQTAIIQKVEQARDNFLDPGVLSPTKQTNMCEGVTHNAGAVISLLISTAPPPVLSMRCMHRVGRFLKVPL